MRTQSCSSWWERLRFTKTHSNADEKGTPDSLHKLTLTMPPRTPKPRNRLPKATDAAAAADYSASDDELPSPGTPSRGLKSPTNAFSPESLASLQTRLSAERLLHSPLPSPGPPADDAAPAKDDARVKYLETAFSAQQMSLDSQSQQILDLKSMIHDLASALSSHQRDPASGSSNFTRAAQVATARALNLSPYPDPSATPDEKDHLGNMFNKLLSSKPSSADTSGKPPSPSQDDLLLNLHHVELNLSI